MERSPCNLINIYEAVKCLCDSTHCLFFPALSASVPITVPSVRRDVLIYLPSVVRSLSDVARSEPARSIRLYGGE